MVEIYYSGLVQLSNDPFSNLEMFIQEGASYVEIFMDGSWWENAGSSLEEIAKKFLSYSLTYSLHGPMFDLNLASFHREIRKVSLQKLKEAVDFAKLVQARHLIVSPGHLAVSTFDKNRAVELFKEELNQLVLYAKSKNILLLIENSGWGGKELFIAEEFTELAKELQKNYGAATGMVLDTGHAHLNHWDIPGLIEELGETLLAIHLNDNDGTVDNHLAMGDGTINWSPIFDSLRRTSSIPRLILEYNTVMPFQRLQEGKSWLIEEGFSNIEQAD